MGKKGFLGEFEQLVMLAVARLKGDEAYGMRIHEELQQTIDRPVSITAVYVTLSRLEEKGLVASWKGEPTAERGGRAKKYFKLEAAGEEALKQSREFLVRLWEGVELGAEE
ncbi:MAG TPA: helix-turn-helix transcriptional regulator [Acidobacteriota bacterium]|nr:helix-turn-helix transcriptional regulator [Acidobacteriota bacterium]